MRIYRLAAMGDIEKPTRQSDCPTDQLPGKSIEALRTIDGREWVHIDAAIRQLETHARDDYLFQIYSANTAVLFQFLDDTLRGLEEDPRLGATRLDWLHKESHRLVMNVLTSMRTFLDHTETHLKRRFGDTSTQVETFKAISSKQFDRHFAYRFLYKFRNYTQHCGLPVAQFSIVSTSRLRPPRTRASKSHSCFAILR